MCTPESLFRQMSTEMDAGPDLWSNLTMGTCDGSDRGGSGVRRAECERRCGEVSTPVCTTKDRHEDRGPGQGMDLMEVKGCSVSACIGGRGADLGGGDDLAVRDVAPREDGRLQEEKEEEVK